MPFTESRCLINIVWIRLLVSILSSLSRRRGRPRLRPWCSLFCNGSWHGRRILFNLSDLVDYSLERGICDDLRQVVAFLSDLLEVCFSLRWQVGGWVNSSTIEQKIVILVYCFFLVVILHLLEWTLCSGVRIDTEGLCWVNFLLVVVEYSLNVYWGQRIRKGNSCCLKLLSLLFGALRKALYSLVQCSIHSTGRRLSAGGLSLGSLLALK